MQLHWITTLTFFVAFIEVVLSVIIFLGTKSYSARTFVVLLLSYAVWAVTLGVLQGIVTDPTLASFLFSLTFYQGLFITLLFFYFTLTYPDNTKPPYWVLVSLGIFFVSQFPVYFGEGLIYTGVQPDVVHFGWQWVYGPLSNVFLIPFSLFWGIGLFHLFFKSRTHSSPEMRKHLKFMFWALLISATPASVFTLTLPSFFNIHQYNVLSPIAGILLVGVLSYSIIKHNQMNLRVVGTELLILAAMFLLFFSIFI